MGQCLIMRILVVRLSALGDIVHALPGITDLRRAFPEATIDVATDERFVDIPLLHAGVDKVISIALKRWKKRLGHGQTWREIRQALRALRQDEYDLVIDVHGLNKSALIGWLARGRSKVGPHPRYCGEWLAPRLYDRRLDPPEAWEPVPRMRQFVALALGQPLAGPADFGLRATWCGQASSQVALIHSTSAQDKLWPEADWVALGRALAARGLELVIPWGSEPEHERAQRIAQGIAQGAPAVRCTVGPRQSIAHWATQLAGCRLVVGVDTGLTHLAAAAGVPCVAIFVATDDSLFVPQHADRAASLGGGGHAPALDAVLENSLRLVDGQGALHTGRTDAETPERPLQAGQQA